MPIANAQPIEINVVGSSSGLGIYPKISAEQTWNMFISDGWLINYAGFQKKIDILPGGKGRGLFNSFRGGFMLAVISSSVFRIDSNLNATFIANIDTTQGEVFIDENLSSQICLVDGQDAYVYNYATLTFTKQVLTFLGNPIIPGYVSYHNTFFLFGSSPHSINPQNWYAFQPFTGTPPTPDGTPDLQFVSQFSIQTKPDSALIVERLPGRGNNVLVVGSSVAEVWTQVGGAQNYLRVSSYNIDYGVISVSTLAANEEQICYLAQNENNSPSLMVTNGSETKVISTDGISHLLDEIQFPSQSDAFFFRQDDHLFYQLTFFNPVDNLTLTYDFTTNQFFHVSDENLNYHPARKVAFFNENTYFISINDGALYDMNTRYVTYNYSLDDDIPGSEIPRVRICKTIQKPDSGRFRIGQFTMIMEQGVVPQNSPTPARVDMSFSKNGNQSFSNVVSKELNPVGVYRNQIRWWRMGQANTFTIQLRFYGFQRFVIGPALLEIY